MSQITGEITVRHEGRDYRLRMSMRVLATLQQEFGERSLEDLFRSGGTPNFAACLRLVELSLHKDHRAEAGDLADDLMTADPGIVGRLVEAAFPDATGAGDGEARPGKRKAATG